jgi:hypothetical protein
LGWSAITISLQYVINTLKKVIADDQVAISITQEQANSPASPLRPEIIRAMFRITDTMWPGVVVLPTISTGAIDGRSLRAAGIPTYGAQGFFNERDDNRAHGRECWSGLFMRARLFFTNWSRSCRRRPLTRAL